MKIRQKLILEFLVAGVFVVGQSASVYAGGLSTSGQGSRAVGMGGAFTSYLQNRACRFPAHGSSVKLTRQTTVYTDGEQCEVQAVDTVNKEDIKGMLNYEAIVLNDEDIPVTRLDVLFDVPSLGLQGQPIVLVRKGQEKLGLAVDAFLTTQEIVIKPLNKLVRENKYFSGSTIIGSGEVVLILDVANLMLTKRAHNVEYAVDRE